MTTRNVILLTVLPFCGNMFSQEIISRLKTFYNETPL
jgi:hypothetical protein